MSELDKLEYLLELINKQTFSMDVKEAFKFTQAYSYLFTLNEKMKQKEDKS